MGINNRIVVGSYALFLHGVTEHYNDIDLFILEGSQDFPENYDCSGIPSHIYDHIISSSTIVNCSEFTWLPSLKVLLTIKLSHMNWDINWNKHKLDALHLMRLGVKIDYELFHILVEHWEDTHGGKDYLSLYQTKDEFFKMDVPLGYADKPFSYKYDHDYLHELVALPNKPVYTKCIKDGERVAIDKYKFFSLPFDEQVKMFKEEIAVIAFERFLVPKLTDVVSIAWSHSLKKVVTNLTKGWASEFIILNIDKFNKPDYNMFTNLMKLEGVDMSENEALNLLNEKIKKMGIDCILVDDYKSQRIVLRLATNNCDCDISESIINHRSYEFIEMEGGGEGDGEHVYGVFKIDGTYFRTDWSYYSYDGYDTCFIIENLKIVKPVQKTITVYE